MGKNVAMLGLAILVVSLSVLVIIGFTAGIANPLPWISLILLVVVILAHNKIVQKRYLSWDDSYSVGIDSMDTDHKRLIHLINNLQTAIDYKTDTQFERQTLDEVIDYTKYHFKREEDFMQEHGYADYQAHKTEHENMISKVNAFVKAYEDDEAGAIQSLLEFLKYWLINHINGTDQQYSEFFASKGIK